MPFLLLGFVEQTDTINGDEGVLRIASNELAQDWPMRDDGLWSRIMQPVDCDYSPTSGSRKQRKYYST